MLQEETSSGGKRPNKQHYQLKERSKIEHLVFDRSTLKNISKIMKKGIFEMLDYPISTGKEAIVFKATNSTGASFAVKIYKMQTSLFLKKTDYIIADPRFQKIKLDEKNIIYSFVKKEFKNLEICERAGVHAPKPIFLEGNVLVISFLGEKGLPYPMLNQTICEEKFIEPIVENIAKMYNAGLVHADLSEYNIMIGNDATPYFIDFGQGVMVRHPKAKEFLERDVKNVLNFFKKFGIEKDFEETIKKITNPKNSASGNNKEDF